MSQIKKITKFLTNLQTKNKNKKYKNNIKNHNKNKKDNDKNNITKYLTNELLQKQYQIQPFLVLGSAPNPTFIQTHTLAILTLTPTITHQTYKIQVHNKSLLIIKLHLLSKLEYITMQITQQNYNQIIPLQSTKIIIINQETNIIVTSTIPQYAIIEIIITKDKQDIQDIIEINKSDENSLEEVCEEDEDQNSQDSNFEEEELSENNVKSPIQLNNITKKLKQIKPEQLQLGGNYLVKNDENLIKLPSYQFKYPIMWDNTIWQDNQAQHPELVTNIEKTNQYNVKYPEEKLIVYQLD